MKPATPTKSLPVVRVTRAKTTETPKPAADRDIYLHGLFIQVVEHVARVRSRVDGVEARLKYLETLLENRGIQ
jgi:hypothetical protein